MAPRLTRAEHLCDYKLQVTFDDGREGVIDLEDELWGEVFEPLKDLDVSGASASTPSSTPSCGLPGPTWRRSSSTSTRCTVTLDVSHRASEPSPQRVAGVPLQVTVGRWRSHARSSTVTGRAGGADGIWRLRRNAKPETPRRACCMAWA